MRAGPRLLSRVVVLIAAVTLFGCSGDSSGDTTNDANEAGTSVTTGAPSTTTALPPDEGLVECPVADFREQFKTRVKMLRCTETWALGLFDRDTWNCDSAGCDDTRIFHLENGAWVKKATCYLDAPLTPEHRRCYIPDVGVATDADLPPANIACTIWPENSAVKWIDETGCPVDEAVIEQTISTECESWVPNEVLPLEPCDSGPLVKKLQRALRTRGAALQIDGFYGPDTIGALAQFQADSGLRRTGIVDQATWAALVR